MENLGSLKKINLREVKTKSSPEKLQEIEVVFQDAKTGAENRFIFGGIKLEEIPALKIKEYYKGLYMPMGIAIPPFYQSYSELLKNNPLKSTYYSFLLDPKDRWLNHHEIGLDGPVLHRDKLNPRRFHLYLLSYERHTLIGHFIFEI